MSTRAKRNSLPGEVGRGRVIDAVEAESLEHLHQQYEEDAATHGIQVIRVLVPAFIDV